MTDAPAHEWNVKIYASEGASVETDAIVRVFHGWIQAHTLPEILIDVADYSHVHEGPGVLLVCHGAQYALDSSEGRLGLLYARKRAGPKGELAHTLETSLRAALGACRMLEEDSALGGRLRFRGDELRLSLQNRLAAPNEPATYARIEPEIAHVLGRLFGDAKLAVEREPDAREAFGLRVRAPATSDVATLLARLDGG